MTLSLVNDSLSIGNPLADAGTADSGEASLLKRTAGVWNVIEHRSGFAAGTQSGGNSIVVGNDWIVSESAGSAGSRLQIRDIGATGTTLRQYVRGVTTPSPLLSVELLDGESDMQVQPSDATAAAARFRNTLGLNSSLTISSLELTSSAQFDITQQVRDAFGGRRTRISLRISAISTTGANTAESSRFNLWAWQRALAKFQWRRRCVTVCRRTFMI